MVSRSFRLPKPREPGSSDVISIRELRTVAVERRYGCLDPEQPTIVGRPSSATKTFAERSAHDTGCIAVDFIKLMSGEIAEHQICSEVIAARAAELKIRGSNARGGFTIDSYAKSEAVVDRRGACVPCRVWRIA